AVFTVSLSPASGQTVTVNYSIPTRRSSDLADYVAASGTLTFPPGSTTQTIVVTVNGDTLNEANETFFVKLSSQVNAALTDDQGVGAINNDDPLPVLAINDVAVTEGNSGTVN